MANITVIKNETIAAVAKEFTGLTETNALTVPEGYSVSNALNSAWLKILDVKDRSGSPAITSCTGASLRNALLDMLIQGLSPARDQCYFVVYGKELVMMPSYFGKVAALKRTGTVKDVVACVVYKDDVFEIDIKAGSYIVVKHETKFGNADGGILGAYCTLTFENGSEYTEVMTRKQIDAAWSMSKSANSPARAKFADQMAKKTVINRAVKLFLKSVTDDNVIIDSVVRTTEDEYRDKDVTIEEQVIEIDSNEGIDLYTEVPGSIEEG